MHCEINIGVEIGSTTNTGCINEWIQFQLQIRVFRESEDLIRLHFCNSNCKLCALRTISNICNSLGSNEHELLNIKVTNPFTISISILFNSFAYTTAASVSKSSPYPQKPLETRHSQVDSVSRMRDCIRSTNDFQACEKSCCSNDWVKAISMLRVEISTNAHVTTTTHPHHRSYDVVCAMTGSLMTRHGSSLINCATVRRLTEKKHCIKMHYIGALPTKSIVEI